MTEKITSGQENRLCDLFRDAIRAMGLSKDEAQDFIQKGGLLQSAMKETLRKFETVDKLFEPFINLGTLVVPSDYVNSDQLGNFNKKYRHKFLNYNDAMTDQNFNNPSYVLKPGDKLQVNVFKQTVPRTTTSEERMSFLSLQKSVVFLGAQGATLVWEQKRKNLIKGYYYCSFDHRENLWISKEGGNSWFPRLDVYDDAYEFHLNDFEVDLYEDYCLLCFSLV